MLIKNTIVSLFLVSALSGCSSLYDTFVYQIDVTQGNYIDTQKMAQLELGMDQQQVIFLLGSPMLVDPFDSSSWYYIRYIKPGGEAIQQQQIVLKFENRILQRIEKEKEIEISPLVEEMQVEAEKA